VLQGRRGPRRHSSSTMLKYPHSRSKPCTRPKQRRSPSNSVRYQVHWAHGVKSFTCTMGSGSFSVLYSGGIRCESSFGSSLILAALPERVRCPEARSEPPPMAGRYDTPSSPPGESRTALRRLPSKVDDPPNRFRHLWREVHPPSYVAYVCHVVHVSSLVCRASRRGCRSAPVCLCSCELASHEKG